MVAVAAKTKPGLIPTVGIIGPSMHVAQRALGRPPPPLALRLEPGESDACACCSACLVAPRLATAGRAAVVRRGCAGPGAIRRRRRRRAAGPRGAAVLHSRRPRLPA